VGRLNATQLVQLLWGHLALRDELFGTRRNEIVAGVDVVVDAIAGLLEASGGEHIAEQEVSKEEMRAVVRQGGERVVGGKAEVGEEGRPVRIASVLLRYRVCLDTTASYISGLKVEVCCRCQVWRRENTI
jgi:hypothetical protein